MSATSSRLPPNPSDGVSLFRDSGPLCLMAKPSSPIASRVARIIVCWHRLILLIILLAVAIAGWRVSLLHLKPDFTELLPARDPAVAVLHEMAQRMKGLSTVVVVVQSPSPRANQQFVDKFIPRLRALALPAIDEISGGVKDLQAFYRRNKFLYASLDDLQQAYDRLNREIARRKNPFLIDLEESRESFAAESKRIDRLEQKLLGKFPEGYFATQDRQLYAVVVHLKSSIFNEGSSVQTANIIRQTALSMNPGHYHPQMSIGLAGSVITAAEERHALENDLVIATTISCCLICLAIFLFYGQFRLVPLAAIPAFCGVIFAFAFAQLAFGYLNSATAFMGSIIVGNGINYAIVQLARYEEERRRGHTVQNAIAISIATTWRATLLASLGAVIAYGSLAITSFRGFSQFGYIGSVGMLLSWMMTMLVVPSLLVLLDHRSPSTTVPYLKGFSVTAPLARFTIRYASPLLIVGVLLTIGAILPLKSYIRDPFEYDFSRLRNQRSRQGETEILAGKLNSIFGRTLSPNFVLARDASQAEEIRQALLEQDRKLHVIGSVNTINQFLPGDPSIQKQKLTVLSKIRSLIDHNLKLLDGDERAQLVKLRPTDNLHLLRPQDLPLGIRRYYTEIDGTIGRVVVYYPKEDISVWDGRTLMKIASVVQNIKLRSGETVRSSGTAVVFAAMLKSITHDGVLLTAVALGGVSLLVLLLTWRRGGALPILCAMYIGVLWMIGAAAVADIRINFLNFIALPITFGIGVDYGINLYFRYVQEGPGRMETVIKDTGGAVGLCSLTTIIGYGALLVADNYALRSFGAMSILGEITCISAALVVLPAMLVVYEQRNRSRGIGKGANE